MKTRSTLLERRRAAGRLTGPIPAGPLDGRMRLPPGEGLTEEGMPPFTADDSSVRAKGPAIPAVSRQKTQRS